MANIHTCKHAGIQSGNQAHIHTSPGGQPDTQSNIQPDKQTHRQSDNQANRKTNIRADKQATNHTYIYIDDHM